MTDWDKLLNDIPEPDEPSYDLGIDDEAISRSLRNNITYKDTDSETSDLIDKLFSTEDPIERQPIIKKLIEEGPSGIHTNMLEAEIANYSVMGMHKEAAKSADMWIKKENNPNHDNPHLHYLRAINHAFMGGNRDSPIKEDIQARIESLDAAIESFEKIINNPQYKEEAHIHLPHLYLIKGILTNNPIDMAKAIASEPEKMPNLLLTKSLETKVTDGKEMEKRLYQATRGTVHPKILDVALAYTVSLLADEGNYDRARTHAEEITDKGLKTGAKAKVLFREKKYLEALGMYDLALSIKGDLTGEEWLRRGESLVMLRNEEIDRKGKPEYSNEKQIALSLKAIKSFDKIVENKTDDVSSICKAAGYKLTLEYTLTPEKKHDLQELVLILDPSLKSYDKQMKKNFWKSRTYTMATMVREIEEKIEKNPENKILIQDLGTVTIAGDSPINNNTDLLSAYDKEARKAMDNLLAEIDSPYERAEEMIRWSGYNRLSIEEKLALGERAYEIAPKVENDHVDLYFDIAYFEYEKAMEEIIEIEDTLNMDNPLNIKKRETQDAVIREKTENLQRAYALAMKYDEDIDEEALMPGVIDMLKASIE